MMSEPVLFYFYGAMIPEIDAKEKQ